MPNLNDIEPPQRQLGKGEALYQEALERWQTSDGTTRLFERDASLWTGNDEDRWLGWLDGPAAARPSLATWQSWAERAQAEGFRDVVVLGMGGSSLCPDVLSQIFEPTAGELRLRILDSTVSAEIRSLTRQIDLQRTLFVVSSKSGSTIEPTVLMDYFRGLIRDTQATDSNVAHFLAITDPGSQLEALARREAFWQIAHGIPSIGGRFSALSAFGLLPAAFGGLDLSAWLRRAETMERACRPNGNDATNPGVSLGLAMGSMARAGRDKLTLLLSPAIAPLGTWLEQLVAESTGKNGVGILPVEGEELGPPSVYGTDRLFVYLRLAEEPDPRQDERVQSLIEAGQPVLRLHLSERLDLAGEFYRWPIATAVAGSLLGVNPFDQPDVEAAKQAARQVMESDSVSVAPRDAVPAGRFDADPNLGTETDLEAALAKHFDRLRPTDYFAINAFIERNAEHQGLLQSLRQAVRDGRRVATTVGFGPRFLHSTGQLHKGGPNKGVFLEITSTDRKTLAIPDQSFDFALLNRAQAEGDFRVLCDRGRRVLRVALDPESGFDLKQLVALALRAVGTPSKSENV